jgi:hypothetical protein
MLRQFGGYTYDTLLEADPELIRLMHIEQRGTPERHDDPMGGGEPYG